MRFQAHPGVYATEYTSGMLAYIVFHRASSKSYICLKVYQCKAKTKPMPFIIVGYMYTHLYVKF